MDDTSQICWGMFGCFIPLVNASKIFNWIHVRPLSCQGRLASRFYPNPFILVSSDQRTSCQCSSGFFPSSLEKMNLSVVWEMVFSPSAICRGSLHVKSASVWSTDNPTAKSEALNRLFFSARLHKQWVVASFLNSCSLHVTVRFLSDPDGSSPGQLTIYAVLLT